MNMNKKSKLKIDTFAAVKNRCILHGRVFVMMDTHNIYDFTEK